VREDRWSKNQLVVPYIRKKYICFNFYTEIVHGLEAATQKLRPKII
jgi:hypothetical protein